jgi:3-deoxy-D-manno-octulosonate 8-phosphate phosphatase KdsC-like HAD superfamily phosphatase
MGTGTGTGIEIGREIGIETAIIPARNSARQRVCQTTDMCHIYCGEVAAVAHAPMFA